MKKVILVMGIAALLVGSEVSAQAAHEGHQQATPKKKEEKPVQQSTPRNGMQMPSGHDMSDMPPGDQMPAQEQQSMPQGHQMPGMQMERQKPQQPMPPHEQMPGMQMGTQDVRELINKSPSNFLPPLGSGQAADSNQTFTLQELEQRALKNNPTLIQAAAEIRSARGRTQQAGLWPNPTIGYSGEQIRGGSFGGGEQGGFVEQRFVLGRKLALSRNVAKTEVGIAEIEAEEQKMRVLTAVRIAFFQVLASQEALNLARHNIELVKASLATAQRFNNIGQTDRSEVLQSDIEVQRQELTAAIEETRLRRDWQALAALIGEPTLPLSRLDARLEQNLPTRTGEQLLDSLLRSSPAVRIADANVARSAAILTRAGREAIPDLTVRAGVQQNNEQIETSGRKVGLQGFAEVGIQLPIFNRNQGNVAAARADQDRAKAEADRVRLVLRERAASTVQSYAMSQKMVQRYQQQILPKAQQLFEMQLKAWGQMSASYTQVLLSQQTLFSAQREYIQSLQQLHRSSLALEGFLLTDGLEAPARPGEVDFPVRELNLPNPSGMN
jgi:cobalt-zinc-cadmium efflux system outer membrane protein